MTIKACRAKNTVAYVKCAHCHVQIKRGMWIIALRDERMVVHEKCYAPVAEQIMKLRESINGS